MRSVCYRGEPAIPTSKSDRQGLFLTQSCLSDRSQISP